MPVAATSPSPTLEVLWPVQDRDRTDLYLAAFLAESRRRHAASPRVRPLYDRAAAFVLRGGKRLRPRLCLASYRIASGRSGPPPRPVWLVAASLELFHAFMLVHDDLIDGSTTRRGRPTLHEAARRDGDHPDGPRAAKHAADLGLVAGDLLCALGMRMIGRAGLDGAALGRAQRLVADMLFETGTGEALDVLFDACPLGQLTESEILDAYVRKTARYSVSGPLVLGAALAGALEASCRALRRFGDLLGLGYQIQNDLDGLAGDPDSDEFADLDGGKRTLVLWLAHHLLPEPGRRALADALALPPGPERRHRLLDLIHASGALPDCRARLATLRRDAIAVLRSAPLAPDQRRAFLRLAGLFRSRKT